MTDITKLAEGTKVLVSASFKRSTIQPSMCEVVVDDENLHPVRIRPEFVKVLGVREAGNALQDAAHSASLSAGWWNDHKTGVDMRKEAATGTRLGKALVAEKLALIHSEISEGLEGHRKGLMDDKLPHRSMLEVELADAVIRIGDLAGALGFDLGGALAEKMAFNAVRPDHKAEARNAAGGKSY